MSISKDFYLYKIFKRLIRTDSRSKRDLFLHAKQIYPREEEGVEAKEKGDLGK